MSLNVTKNDLVRHIRRKLAYGVSGSLSSAQSTNVADVLANALRRFYEPDILPGERDKHQWSFLFPTKRFQFAASQWRFDLPADFSMLNGPITYARGEDSVYPSIQIVGPQHIYQKQQQDDTAGRPLIAAVQVKAVDQVDTTRHELLVYPTSDSDYEVALSYKVNPFSLDHDTALPLGGQAHAQTLIAACLAECAVLDELNDGADEARFIERMRSSISHDRKLSAPETLGVNYDRSDGYDYGHCPNIRFGGWGIVHYNGAPEI